MPEDELCNGVDDDCNGQIDDGNPGGGGGCDTGFPGVCEAGTPACMGGGLVCLQNQPARRRSDGDDFVVSGQKTWTTYAQYADWIFCLVRTNPTAKRQAGITFLLIDMKTPGVEARPMLTIGEQPAFCDTFFENVRVPKANAIGPIDGGWTVAKALLGHERTLLALVGSSIACSI